MSAFLSTKSNWIIIGAVLVMSYLLLFRWNSTAQLEKQQAALISGIEDNRWGRCEKRISENYEDLWGWKRDDLRLVFADIRSQFLAMGLYLDNPVWDVASRKATLNAKVRIEGSPLGMGSTIQRMVNREDEPMTFTWEKESWQPWSWKLVRINHPEIDPEGYEPGDLIRARDGKLSF